MDPHLWCRAVGHSWSECDSSASRHSFGVPYWMKCGNCGTIRKDWIDPTTGELRQRSYLHPDSYRRSNPGLSRAELRARLYRIYLRTRKKAS